MTNIGLNAMGRAAREAAKVLRLAPARGVHHAQIELRRRVPLGCAGAV